MLDKLIQFIKKHNQGEKELNPYIYVDAQAFLKDNKLFEILSLESAENCVYANCIEINKNGYDTNHFESISFTTLPQGTQERVLYKLNLL